METHIGKLRKVKGISNIEQWCQTLCSSKGLFELKSYYRDWADMAKDHFGDEYLITDTEVYEKFDNVEVEDDYVYHIQENPDGTLSYVMRFYNGGTCLSECLEESIEELNKSKD